MQASETLRGYAHLLALVREGSRAGLGTDEAVRRAVDRCIAEGVLADYLSKHRMEAMEMLFTMEDEERAMRVHWETVDREAREQGFARGLEQGLEQGKSTISAKLRELGVDESIIAQATS